MENILTGEVRSCEEAFLLAAVGQEAVVREADDHDQQEAIRLPRVIPDERELAIDKIPMALRSEASMRVAVEKNRWISRLKRHGVKRFRPGVDLSLAIKEVERDFGAKCPYTEDTLYKTWLWFRSHGDDPRSVLPNFRFRGAPGVSRLDERVEAFIETALKYAADPKAGRLQPSKVHQAVVSKVNQANLMLLQSQRLEGNATTPAPPVELLKAPSVPTITRRFREAFAAYDVAKRNYGKARADRLYRENGARIRGDSPLDVVAYDDTDTCVFAVNEVTGLPWGRCWLTIGVDESTRVAMGKSLSEHPRCTWSALSAVLDGIYPKDPRREDLVDCVDKWEPYGHHGIVLLDNASYNHAIALEASLLDLGCEIEYSRPRKPTDKPDIEHFNHILKSDFVRNLSGWSGPKEDREMLDEGIGTAVMTAGEFHRALTRWIVDQYMNKPGGKDGKSPRQRWLESFALGAPLMPQRLPSIELARTVKDELTLRDSGGLLRLGLRYQSEELKEIRRRLGCNAKVVIRYPKNHVMYLYVQDPVTTHYVQVPCIEDDRFIAGLTDHAQRLILKRCLHMKYTSPSLAKMVLAREALVADTKKLSHSKKLIERKQAQVAFASGLGEPESNPKKGTATQAVLSSTVIVSALEAEIDELDAIDLTSTPEMRVFIHGQEV